MTKKIINELAYKIVGSAIEVHKTLGPGLIERVYECCLIEELQRQGLCVKSQIIFPINYKGKIIDSGLRIDLLVDDCIIVELKSVEKMNPIFEAQLLTYLRLTSKPKGLLINFNCKNISSELVPLVTEEYSKLPD